MTLSISDQPSQWHRVTTRHSLLNDATIDPFPYRQSRTASLLDHHIVRSQSRDVRMTDDGRRSTVHHLPPVALQIAPSAPPPQLPAPPNLRIAPPPLTHPDHFHDSEGRKRSYQAMASQELSEGSSSPTSIGQGDGTNNFCLCQPEPKVPRPRNAFILYRQHSQAAVARANPGLPNPDISKIIGEQWSNMRDDAKKEWRALAEEEKARHAQQYPDYRYQPRRNGRYSSQSSGSGPPSGGKVDKQGNCIKCGGKTMNPPTTPYAANHHPTTPRGSATAMPRSGQPMVSPPQSGRPPYSDRHWPPLPPPPPRYHDPRVRYPSVAEGLPDAPDLKRRRFDGNGIYIPTREWREGPYQYSPRGSYYRGEMPPDGHRPSMTGPPPRPMYPAPAATQPKLQLVRPPPPPQHKRDPSLTLPPLTTPASGHPTGAPNSGLEAMIMSIPVINKVKILSQISPHLPAPSLSSPTPEVRGSIVAIEGSDPTSVYSMTNSLAEELERDGKFAVRIFGGPDPYSLWSNAKHGLSIADTLSVIGEWHKISEEMKRYITTKVSPVSDSAISVSTRKSGSLDTAKTPDRRASTADDKTSPTSLISPHNTSSEQPLTTPPSHRPSYSSFSQSDATTPFTRIPAAALPQPSLSTSQPTNDPSKSPTRTTRSSTSTTATKLDTLPPPISTSQPPTPTTATNNAASPTSPPITSPSPIPIALVPHYQLTTVDTAAITLPINDSYSPLAHWQWLATLWRGCVGPDVSIVIRGPSPSVEQGLVETSPSAAAGVSAPAGEESAKKDGAEPEKKDASAEGGRGVDGRASVASAGGSSSRAGSGDSGGGQGVDVRLLECRAVVVRMGQVVGKDGVGAGGGSGVGQGQAKEQAEFWEKAKRRVGFEVGEFLRR